MDTNTAQPENAPVNKAPRFRSVAYPSNDIPFCVELTTRINKTFGNLSYTKREPISKILEIGDSQLQSQLSSCVQYGLLELKLSEGYKPTPLFTKIYKPLPTENKNDALVECFQNPDLYKALIKQYNGADLPLQAGLATILYRNHKVSEQAATLAAKVFIQNAKAIGILRENGRFGIPLDEGPEDLLFEEIENKPPLVETATRAVLLTQPQQEQEKRRNNNEAKIPVLLDDGGIAEITLPNGIKKTDLERIVKVLNAYVQ